jgi:hypothetical protein
LTRYLLESGATFCKQQLPASQFQQEWNFYTHPVASCTPTITDPQSTPVKGTITRTLMNSGQSEVYDVTLAKDGQNKWKIDSMQKE